MATTADREIVITRVVDIPRALVFEAFTEVRHLSRDEAVEKYHAIEGGRQTLGNLAACLTENVRKGVEG